MDFTYNECNQCPNGEYSLDQKDGYCSKCPNNAECDYNGSYINVNPGYWRSDYFSTNIIECFISDACLGNSCQNGYEGPLCDTCVVNSNVSYFKAPQLGCKACQGEISSFIIMSIVIQIKYAFFLFILFI